MVFYQLIIFILLLTLPFIPVQIDIKITYALGIISPLLLTVLIYQKHVSIKKIKENFLNFRSPFFYFALFLFFATASTLFSISPKLSFYQLILFYDYFFVFLTARYIFPDFKSKENLALIIIILTSILSIFSLYNTLILRYVNREAEGVSFLWNYYGHNHLAGLLIFSIPLCFYFIFSNVKSKISYLLFLAVCFLLTISLFFTFGIGSIISLLSSVFISYLIFGKSLPVKINFYWTIPVVIFILAVFSFNSFYLSKNISLFKDTPSSAKSRLTYWNQAFGNFLRYPIIGSGLDTFRFVNARESKVKTGSYYAFNFFIQSLSDIGILGFISSIGLIFSLLYQSYKKVLEKLKSSELAEGLILLAFWVAILASTINNMAEFDWQLPFVFFLFWFIVGIF